MKLLLAAVVFALSLSILPTFAEESPCNAFVRQRAALEDAQKSGDKALLKKVFLGILEEMKVAPESLRDAHKTSTWTPQKLSASS